MALFGKKPAELSTNAPRHWRRVPSSAWVKNGGDALNAAIVSGLVMKGLEEDGLTFSLDPFATFLYDDGILSVPAIIEEPSGRTALFTYGAADPAAAAHYSAVRALLRQREQIAAVYFAPGALAPAAGGRALEALDTHHFTKDEDERPEAEYALWWSTAEEPSLATSPALADLDGWFEALDGVGSYLFSALVTGLGLAGPDAAPALYALPEAPAVVPVEAPGGLRVYLNASASDGLWFAFDVGVPAARRNLFLKLLAGMAQRFKAVCLERGVPLRPEDAGAQLEFWRAARGRAIAAAGEEGVRIGVISDAGLKGRFPGATTSAERAQGPAASTGAPSDALVAFADEQLRFACALVAERVGADDGNPNLSPFVAMRVGERTETVTLDRFTEPEAAERAPVVVAERDTEMVVLACDGVVRMGGDRFDAIRLRVQERGTPRSFEFFQRYRLTDRLELVGNWALSGTGEPLFSDAAPPPVGEPPAAVRETAAFRLEQLLRWVTVGDPSGMGTYRPHEPLFSPSLHTRWGDGWKQARYAMGNEAWAEGAALAECHEPKSFGVSVAVLETDEVVQVDGIETRRFRFRVHHRGDETSWIFVQRYATPSPGQPFRTVGELEVLRTAEPMLPGPALPVPVAPIPAPAAAAPASGGPPDPGAVERRRLELTQSLQQRLQAGRRNMLSGSRTMERSREVDLAEVLRFAAPRCDLADDGLSIFGPAGPLRRLLWTEVTEAWVRRMPAEWSRVLLVELGAGDAAPPVRILPSTAINFRNLPGGAAPARNENLRKLVQMAGDANPDLAMDEPTRAWVERRQEAVALGSIKEFAEHDVRFG